MRTKISDYTFSKNLNLCKLSRVHNIVSRKDENASTRRNWNNEISTAQLPRYSALIPIKQ